MASTSISGKEILVFASEIVGYKSGLAVSRERMLQLLEPTSKRRYLLEIPEDKFQRIRLEEFEFLVAELLYALGVSDTPELGHPLLVAHYARDPIKKPIALRVGAMLTTHLSRELKAIREGRSERLIDPTPFLDEALEECGPLGAEIALEMLQKLIDHSKRSPWTEDRTVEWKDMRQLDELFESERLSTIHGTYFDQRFVNYLHANFDDIARINWRKFEGLAGEYLKRSGFSVEIGPGRNDGSIDIRAWTNDTSLPPTILVQCKREKQKVGKVIVKALWADILEERAESGLIVTSTALSPGAQQVCKARNYPINQANRHTLRKWIQEMRTPGSGVFLGE